MFYEYVNEQKYVCWTVEQFVEGVKNYHKNRVMAFIAGLALRSVERQISEGLAPLNIDDAVRDIQEQRGEIYEMFREYNSVGGDDFLQEVHVALAFVDLLLPKEVQSISFRVMKDCPEEAHLPLEEVERYRETNSGYDFVIKKNGLYIKYQLKSAPERYISEFSSDYFTEDIKRQVARYRDQEMVLVYLLQPSIERVSENDFYSMFDVIFDGVKDVQNIRSIFFVGRSTLQTFEYIEVYPKLSRQQIDLTQSLMTMIRNTPIV